MKKFTEYGKFSLPEINQQVLKQWDQERVFEQSVTTREGQPRFVFYEGPPSANGMPGIHHVLARSIKDIICRYKTMQGYQVLRKAGWDTHGLPVELSVEKSLGITKDDIGKKISVEDYNATCRREVMKYTREWEDLTHRMGYWVDLKDPYITYKNSYIETLWWLLKQLYDKGLLYKGYTIQPYSPAAGTGLSSHELNMPGCYRDVKDTTVTAQFLITEPREAWTRWGQPVFLAWTTTPWTLPSNVALCVNPRIDYVAVATYNPYTAQPVTAIMAQARVQAYLKPQGQVEAGEPLPPFKHGDKVVPWQIVDHMKGSDLLGIHYQQLMPWVKPCMATGKHAKDWVNDYAQVHPQNTFESEDGRHTYVQMADQAFRVIPGDYVTTDDGTGIVHTASTFGADDARVCADAQVPALYLIDKKGDTRPMVDLKGKYYVLDELDANFVKACVDAQAYGHHAGDYVKNAYDPRFNPGGVWNREATEKNPDLNVVMSLEMKQQGTAFKIEKMVHNYPHCWRTDKPILYYPLDSWFIKSTACRDRMVELNKTIRWKPEYTGTGRFGHWLENLNDWNLSRSRYWGTPLPIWRNDDGEELCIGSIKQLYDEIDRSVAAGLMKSNPLRDKGFTPGDYSTDNYKRIDLHRPYVDHIVLVSPTGKPLHREADLIDVWFDSGSMPYAQLHYPFENKQLIDSRIMYPADFIAEGVDQTRGWFFTLHAIATMVFNSVAYKSVISNGLVLDKSGNKMSKRLGNAVDPFKELTKFGADPLRWYMISNSSPWDNLKFDEEGVAEVSRKFFGTLYNTYSFFALYANLDHFDPDAPQVPLEERPEIDRWIISLLNTLVADVTACIDDYEPTRAARAISEFVTENLSNWYVRLNRKRYWAGEMTAHKLAAYQTLHQCLTTVALLMAPIAPFYADRLYRDLTGSATSVHLAQWPRANEAAIDKQLEHRQQVAQQITSMVLSLRRKSGLKVRQPLQCIMVPVANDQQRAVVQAVADLIKSEVNVKEIRLVSSDEGVLVKRVKPNFRKLGPKFGKIMKDLAAQLTALPQDQINRFEQQGSIALEVKGQQVTVDAADVEIISEDIPGWLVANEGRLTVALDVTLTPELQLEGTARELVNRIQNIRKTRDYELTDRINVVVEPNEHTSAAVAGYGDYIARQVLAQSLTTGPVADGDDTAVLDMDDYSVRVKVSKA